MERHHLHYCLDIQLRAIYDLSFYVQGYSVSLSSDGGILAVGSPYDNNWVGATWIFVFDESTGTYNQWGEKLFDAGSAGSSPRQGKGVPSSNRVYIQTKS